MILGEFLLFRSLKKCQPSLDLLNFFILYRLNQYLKHCKRGPCNIVVLIQRTYTYHSLSFIPHDLMSFSSHIYILLGACGNVASDYN